MEGDRADGGAGTPLLSYRLNQSLWFASLIALGVGVAGAFVISASFAAPVKRLAKSLRESDPAKEVLLPQTGIVEIDGLSAAVEELSAAVANSASRLSQILEYTNTSGGRSSTTKNGGDWSTAPAKLEKCWIFPLKTERNPNSPMTSSSRSWTR